LSKVNILVLDADDSSQSAVRQMLDSEGWGVHITNRPEVVLPALAKGAWTLVIANIAITGLSGPLFETLKELALAPAIQEGKGRLRVLFLLPENLGADAQQRLEHERLAYVLRPFNLHDFLDKVSDLLMENGAIPQPIRRVRLEAGNSRKRPRSGESDSARTHDRGQSMFARQSDYMMTEEEIAEYERQEKEEEARRRKKNILGT
jgi:DNA-binding response OmpR family regulator